MDLSAFRWPIKSKGYPDQVVKLCIGMFDAEKTFCNASVQFANGIRDLAVHSHKDKMIETSLLKFSEALNDIVTYRTMFMEQGQKSVKTQLQTFVKEVNPNQIKGQLGKALLTHPILNIFGELIEKDLRQMRTSSKQVQFSNLEPKEWELMELLKKEGCRIMKPDNGRGVVLMYEVDYDAHIYEMLQDEEQYEVISKNEMNIAHSKIEYLLYDHLLQGVINERIYNFLHVDKPKIPVIFGIPKTHKGLEQLRFRPIVAGAGSITEPLAKFIDEKLKEFMSVIGHICKDSWEFLKDINDTWFDTQLWMLIIDVVELFPSIPHQIGLKWFGELRIDLLCVNDHVVSLFPESEIKQYSSTLINVLQSKSRSEILKSMLSFMFAHLTFFHQGYDLFSELEPYMKELTSQLDQLVVDGKKEKKEMEQKHSTIQQKLYCRLLQVCVSDYRLVFYAPHCCILCTKAEAGQKLDKLELITSDSKGELGWRWFSIQNNQLVYQKKFKDSLTVVVEDLRLCTAKHCEDIERRFCFEVVSPTKSCILQADSEKLRQAWIQAVQTSIATAFREKGEEAEKLERRSSGSAAILDSGGESKEKLSKGENLLQQIQSIAGNSSCCDCGLTDPRWASINLGIALCIECSGIHRSLGVHFSKVRSLTLDTWEPELLKLMSELGNTVINHIYEARIQELGAKKPQPGDPRHEKEAYIKAKYVDKKFVQKPWLSSLKQMSRVTVNSRHSRESSDGSAKITESALQSGASQRSSARSGDSGLQNRSNGSREEFLSSPSSKNVNETVGESMNLPVFTEMPDLNPGLQLYRAAYERNLPGMAEALAQGADINYVNNEDSGGTALIQAALGGSIVACEFLLQNGANVNIRDGRGRGPLHHATILGHTGQACLFLKRGADQHATDNNGKDPLAIAVEAANADIVTLLRLARMNEEMRESEGPYGQSGDQTYHDIFRDFSQMASDNPEKLNRYQQKDSDGH
ncbi:arf-GAP with coiled-coil, ANK repeat and PH domain-containing protein 2-like [Protopterus annectens]|uniref:arf-GAP with coiled-coil, ANK repeat and PH domain-containing protein 2-like n=1 Tax=Protopterus annectens TaxID=7888 RepID=UPI001CFA6004|nr:arf-GAP with coiled-coil, ANK repeat and PH domain-containing protein 2-like [Protopterus annectens]